MYVRSKSTPFRNSRVTAAPPLLLAKVGEAPPSPALSKRQQRSAQRLQEFQEQKRAALVQGLVSKGADPEVARSTVAREESGRVVRKEKSMAGEWLVFNTQPLPFHPLAGGVFTSALWGSPS